MHKVVTLAEKRPSLANIIF